MSYSPLDYTSHQYYNEAGDDSSKEEGGTLMANIDGALFSMEDIAALLTGFWDDDVHDQHVVSVQVLIDGEVVWPNA